MCIARFGKQTRHRCALQDLGSRLGMDVDCKIWEPD